MFLSDRKGRVLLKIVINRRKILPNWCLNLTELGKFISRINYKAKFNIKAMKHIGKWYGNPRGFLGGTSGKESTCQSKWLNNTVMASSSEMWDSQVVLVVKHNDAGDMRCWFDPWVRKIPWRRAWQPIPVSLPGKSHVPGGHMTEVT